MEKLGGGKENAVRVFPGAVGLDPDPQAPNAMEQLAGALAQLVDFPDLIERELLGVGVTAPNTSRTALVLIDELDRCEEDFIYSILRSVRHWCEAQNMVFILGVNPERLHGAIARSGGTEAGHPTPTYALQKYIQHEINLPGMNEARLQAYLNNLIPDGSDKTFVEIRNAAAYLYSALRGPEYSNPRALKRCLNAIRPLIEYRLDTAPNLTDDERLLIIKEHVLEYRWPEFYSTIFYPAIREAEEPELVDRFRRIEALCQQYASRKYKDWQLVEFELDRLRRTVDGEVSLPREVANYLSISPFWFPLLGTAQANRGSDGSDSMGFRFGSAPFRGEGHDAPPPGSPTGGADPARAEELIPSDLFGDMRATDRAVNDQAFLIYTEGEAAEARGDRDMALRRGAELLEYVRQHRERIRGSFASNVGNAGLTAEKFGAGQLAYDLFELAFEIDPEHSNNMQNYVSFLLDAEAEKLYDRAAELLAKLQTEPHVRHRPERTAAYAMQLARQSKRTVDAPSNAQLESMIQGLMGQPDPGRFTAMATLLRDTGRLDRLREVSMQLAEQARLPQDQYRYLRGYADILARTNDDGLRAEAMDLYLRILHEMTVSEEQHADILHNYATLLYAYDFDQEAGRRWYEAYLIGRRDDTIRGSYARYLSDAGKHDAAASVLNGGELTDSVESLLRLTGRPLPEGRFVDQGLTRGSA